MNPNKFKEDLIIQSYQVYGDVNRIIRYENKTITENNLKDCIKYHVTVYKLVNKNFNLSLKLKCDLYRIGLPVKYVEGTIKFIKKHNIKIILNKLRKLLLPA